MAATYSAGAMHLLQEESFAAFHVSGGTTEVLLATPHASGFDIELFSATADINAGQAIDRVGDFLLFLFVLPIVLVVLVYVFLKWLVSKICNRPVPKEKTNEERLFELMENYFGCVGK